LPDQNQASDYGSLPGCVLEMQEAWQVESDINETSTESKQITIQKYIQSLGTSKLTIIR
jgi:hypothetical protein